MFHSSINLLEGMVNEQLFLPSKIEKDIQKDAADTVEC